MQAILGTKIDQTQKFLEDGTRIPVTKLWVKGNVVVAVKLKEKHNYSAIQLGFGKRKKANKALLGHIKGALNTAPKFLKEIRLEEENISELPAIGEVINATEVFKPGDMVDVVGISKGKGYAGVVKRHHFKGGPRTHGQSDRERAPGSIGQTTTPGRVYKGKRMAGRMGHERVTIKNLEVVGVSEDTLLIKGLVPGGKNTLIMVTKVGENKKFVPLYREKESTEQLAHAEGDARQKEEKPTEDSGSLSEIQPTETTQESMEKSEANFSSPSDDQSPSTTEIISSSESGSAPTISDSDVRTENEEKKMEDKENAS